MIPRHLSSDFSREGVAFKGRERPGARGPAAKLTIKQTAPSSPARVGAWDWEALAISFPDEARNGPPSPPQLAQRPGWRLGFWAGQTLSLAVLSSPLRMDQAITTAPIPMCGHLQGNNIDEGPTVARSIRCCSQTRYSCFLPPLTGCAGPQFPNLHVKRHSESAMCPGKILGL